MSTTITVTGFVATQPKFLVTSKGVPVASFRLGVSERRYDVATKSWVNGDTSWLSVSAFRYLAENASKSLQKGERVVITGRLRVREWQAGEKNGIDVELDAESIGHDLNWGTTIFSRASREAPVVVGGGAGEGVPAPEAAGPVDADGWAAPGLGAAAAGESAFVTGPISLGSSAPEGFSSVTEPEAELETTPF